MNRSLRRSRPLLRGAVVVLALAVSAVALHAHHFGLVPDADAGPKGDSDTYRVTLVFGIEGDLSGGAPPQPHEKPPAYSDSAAVAETVHRFHAALEAGDSATALDLLTEDAIILENGDVETKQEYRSHHLPSDIAFARAVRREAGPIGVVVRGDVAWATSTSTARGTYREREVNSQGAELMVLERTPDGWRISAIHWSSRPIRS
jgi:ketosteroid isomerase-like protein